MRVKGIGMRPTQSHSPSPTHWYSTSASLHTHTSLLQKHSTIQMCKRMFWEQREGRKNKVSIRHFWIFFCKKVHLLKNQKYMHIKTVIGSINAQSDIDLLSHLISSHLIASHFISSHFISSHLISFHLISSHLTVKWFVTWHPLRAQKRTKIWYKFCFTGSKFELLRLLSLKNDENPSQNLQKRETVLMSDSNVYEYSQSHVGWHFRKLFRSSKLKAWTSLFTETWQKRRSSFELWALSFETAFENVTPSGIGCMYKKLSESDDLPFGELNSCELGVFRF